MKSGDTRKPLAGVNEVTWKRYVKQVANSIFQYWWHCRHQMYFRDKFWVVVCTDYKHNQLWHPSDKHAWKSTLHCHLRVCVNAGPGTHAQAVESFTSKYVQAPFNLHWFSRQWMGQRVMNIRDGRGNEDFLSINRWLYSFHNFSHQRTKKKKKSRKWFNSRMHRSVFIKFLSLWVAELASILAATICNVDNNRHACTQSCLWIIFWNIWTFLQESVITMAD